MFIIRKTVTSNEQKLRRLISNEIKTIINESVRPRRMLASLIFEDAVAGKIDPEKFPTTLSAAAAKGEEMSVAVSSGTKDGEDKDDKVKASPASFTCAELKPSQTSMNIDKAVSMAFGYLISGKPGGDLGAFISQDGYIMDGHHRWISTFMVDTSAKINGFKVNLPGEQLVAVLNAYTAGRLGITSGKPATGGFDQFKNEDAIKKAIEKVVKEKGEEADKIVKDKGGVDKLTELFMKNLSGATMSVPGWAPERPDMPVIDEKDVPGALAALNNGEIDLNAPYFKGEEKKESFTKSGGVLVERWQKLAGLIK